MNEGNFRNFTKIMTTVLEEKSDAGDAAPSFSVVCNFKWTMHDGWETKLQY